MDINKIKELLGDGADAILNMLGSSLAGIIISAVEERHAEYLSETIQLLGWTAMWNDDSKEDAFQALLKITETVDAFFMSLKLPMAKKEGADERLRTAFDKIWDEEKQKPRPDGAKSLNEMIDRLNSGLPCTNPDCPVHGKGKDRSGSFANFVIDKSKGEIH